ncbi:MAG: hypothetical protein P8H65_11640 [Rhodothermales bacterium]|nr:hypothetical protein [Rhodothermales bacterium]
MDNGSAEKAELAALKTEIERLIALIKRHLGVQAEVSTALTVSLDEVKDVDGLMAFLSEAEEEMDPMKMSIPIDELERMSLKVREAGERHHAPFVIKWSEALFEAVMIFDIETMKSQLDQFSELVEICRKEVS